MVLNMSSRNVTKKNKSRPHAKDRGLYSGMHKSYHKPKPKLPEDNQKLF